MRMIRIFLTALVGLCLFAGAAHATSVRVFKPGEAGVSPMELRNRAMAEGFAQAVLDEARRMLPVELDEARTELFRWYMAEYSKPYVQGYKILSSEAMDAGLILNLDVIIDKNALRDGLKRMGLMATVLAPQPASLTLPQSLDSEESATLAGLVALTGIRQESVASPVLVLEKGTGNTYTARLDSDNRSWTAHGKDLSVVWFDIWGHYFTRAEVRDARTNHYELSVAGWFSPDAALEFDRMLHEWDSAVQEVELVELDMQPSGVGASWSVRVISGERLDSLLLGYLPQRGLSHQLTQQAGR
jgi:hypothetical protein